MKDVRCKKCNKLLAKYEGNMCLEIKCPRCGSKNLFRDNVLLAEKLLNYQD